MNNSITSGQRPQALPYNDNLLIGPAFAVEFREERLRLGISMYALARTARVSRSMLHYFERHKRKPTLDMADRICRGAGVDFLVLLARARERGAAQSGGGEKSVHSSELTTSAPAVIQCAHVTADPATSTAPRGKTSDSSGGSQRSTNGEPRSLD